MPLPAPDSHWPPVRLATILPKMSEWSAWMAGDADKLAATYGGDSAQLQAIAPARRTSSAGRLRRMFWGNRPQTLDQPAPHRFHIPLPADLCTASAALMFGSPPTVTTEGTDTTVPATMTHLIEERALWETLTTAFTNAAGLGGTYLRASWDPSIEGGAFLSYVDADQASPVWGPYGDLVEVTFHRVLEAQSAGQVTVWRHLERHYLSAPTDTVFGGAAMPARTGLIEHTLWAGTADNIGRQVALSAHPSTEGFAAFPGASPAMLTVTTGSRGLAVEYAKNKGEQLAWRKDPVGWAMGRSDFDQLESSFDTHDRLWSYLVREFDLTKARAFVPASLLRSLGPGGGALFDQDREFFTPLEMPPAINATLDQQLTLTNFSIRVDEHISAIKELQQGILRDAGYSARTFGEDENGAAMTATEVVDRNSRSGITRKSKCNLAGPAIRRVLVKVLQINASLGVQPKGATGAGNTDALTLTWPQGESESPQTRAQTVQMLDAAGAISLWMKLTIAHPGMDADDLLLEYRRIRAEGMTNPDQTVTIGVDDPFTPPEDPEAEALISDQAAEVDAG